MEVNPLRFPLFPLALVEPRAVSESVLFTLKAPSLSTTGRVVSTLNPRKQIAEKLKQAGSSVGGFFSKPGVTESIGKLVMVGGLSAVALGFIAIGAHYLRGAEQLQLLGQTLSTTDTTGFGLIFYGGMGALAGLALVIKARIKRDHAKLAPTISAIEKQEQELDGKLNELRGQTPVLDNPTELHTELAKLDQELSDLNQDELASLQAATGLRDQIESHANGSVQARSLLDHLRHTDGDPGKPTPAAITIPQPGSIETLGQVKDYLERPRLFRQENKEILAKIAETIRPSKSVKAQRWIGNVGLALGIGTLVLFGGQAVAFLTGHPLDLPFHMVAFSDLALTAGVLMYALSFIQVGLDLRKMSTDDEARRTLAKRYNELHEKQQRYLYLRERQLSQELAHVARQQIEVSRADLERRKQALQARKEGIANDVNELRQLEVAIAPVVLPPPQSTQVEPRPIDLELERDLLPAESKPEVGRLRSVFDGIATPLAKPGLWPNVAKAAGIGGSIVTILALVGLGLHYGAHIDQLPIPGTAGHFSLENIAMIAIYGAFITRSGFYNLGVFRSSKSESKTAELENRAQSLEAELKQLDQIDPIVDPKRVVAERHHVLAHKSPYMRLPAPEGVPLDDFEKTVQRQAEREVSLEKLTPTEAPHSLISAKAKKRVGDVMMVAGLLFVAMLGYQIYGRLAGHESLSVLGVPLSTTPLTTIALVSHTLWIFYIGRDLKERGQKQISDQNEREYKTRITTAREKIILKRARLLAEQAYVLTRLARTKQLDVLEHELLTTS